MPNRPLSQRDIETLDIEQLKLALAFSVTLVGRRWKARFAQMVKPSGNTNSRMVALYFLADAPKGLTQAELSELLSVSPATLTRLLDAMESRGMISRRSLIGDRRAKLVFIEDQGRRDLAELDGAASAMRDHLFAGISDADLRCSLKVLRQMAARMTADGQVEEGVGGR